MKYRKKRIFIILLVLLVMAFGWFCKNRKSLWNGRDDFRFTVLSDNGIALVSVSVDRRMLNVLKLDPELPLWVPGGYGWYQSAKIVRLLKQEGKMDLLNDVFFYNFGFFGRKNILVDKIDDWGDWLVMWKNFGLFNMLSLRMKYDGFLVKEEIAEGQDFEIFPWDKVLSRDFADNRLLSSDMRISIINKSGENGLAGFLARRLNWMGYLVLGVETGLDLQDKCFLKHGAIDVNMVYVNLLRKFFPTCQLVYSNFLDESEFELEVGKDFSELIEYESYEK
ncbi:hypothetical protein KKA02_04235 [Patescibacteria group bacterium]|nr:hypothetical protein [Patescibacteria group bacterium]